MPASRTRLDVVAPPAAQRPHYLLPLRGRLYGLLQHLQVLAPAAHGGRLISGAAPRTHRWLRGRPSQVRSAESPACICDWVRGLRRRFPPRPFLNNGHLLGSTSAPPIPIHWRPCPGPRQPAPGPLRRGCWCPPAGAGHQLQVKWRRGCRARPTRAGTPGTACSSPRSSPWRRTRPRPAHGGARRPCGPARPCSAATSPRPPPRPGRTGRSGARGARRVVGGPGDQAAQSGGAVGPRVSRPACSSSLGPPGTASIAFLQTA